MKYSTMRDAAAIVGALAFAIGVVQLMSCRYLFPFNEIQILEVDADGTWKTTSPSTTDLWKLHPAGVSPTKADARIGDELDGFFCADENQLRGELAAGVELQIKKNQWTKGPLLELDLHGVSPFKGATYAKMTGTTKLTVGKNVHTRAVTARLELSNASVSPPHVPVRLVLHEKGGPLLGTWNLKRLSSTAPCQKVQ